MNFVCNFLREFIFPTLFTCHAPSDLMKIPLNEFYNPNAFFMIFGLYNPNPLKSPKTMESCLDSSKYCFDTIWKIKFDKVLVIKRKAKLFVKKIKAKSRIFKT